MRSHDVMRALGAVAVASALAAAPDVSAQEFHLQVGLPIAGNSQPAKDSLLVVRPGGCPNPGSAQITATAEGIVNGVRRSMPLTLTPLPTPGVHALPKKWAETSGYWVVNLVGTCAGRTAGALVPIDNKATFRRETIKQLAHAPTREEIDASLKVLTTGGRR
jgi:hypothetical protein